MWLRLRARPRPAHSGTWQEYADSALRHYELLGTHLQEHQGLRGNTARNQDALRKDSYPFKQRLQARIVGRITQLLHPYSAKAREIVRRAMEVKS